jgi:hypothetical protein
MKIISDATHPPVDVEGNVILATPDVDRATSWEWYLKEMSTVCTGLGQREEM